MEAINCTRNRISSLKVFQVLLYRRLSILQDVYFLYRIRLFVSEFGEYTCINTRKSRASVRTKLYHYQRKKTE